MSALQHGSTLRNSLLQHGLPMRSQILPEKLPQHRLLSPQNHTFCQEPAPVCDLTQSQPPSCNLLHKGVLHGLEVDIHSTLDLHGLRGSILPHNGLLQGNLWSSAWTISSLSFLTDLGVSYALLCRLFCIAVFPLLQ